MEVMERNNCTILHNPRCSKSRMALHYLDEENISYEIVEYLKTPLSSTEITELLQMLKLPVLDIIRKNEELFKTKFKDKTFSEKEWIDILAENPQLIERPIIIHGNNAVIGRPTELIATLFK